MGRRAAKVALPSNECAAAKVNARAAHLTPPPVNAYLYGRLRADGEADGTQEDDGGDEPTSEAGKAAYPCTPRRREE